MSDYICKLSDSVERVHVRYPNRYGIMIAGDLYTAKDMDKTAKHMALIVGAPYGGVKEQGPCVYANELAKRGFVVLTFDPCYMGESGGEPRHVSAWIFSAYRNLWTVKKSPFWAFAAAAGLPYPPRRSTPASKRLSPPACMT